MPAASPRHVVRPCTRRRQGRPAASLTRTLRRVDVERTANHRARPRRWRDLLASALAEHGAISVRGTVISHLRRTPTRAEITAAAAPPIASLPMDKRPFSTSDRLAWKAREAAPI